MTDQQSSADDKITVGRGPSYPFIDLERAVERVEQIVLKGAERSKLSPETFYKLWGYKPKSSGARQTMAALNYFGLVGYVGKGTDRRVTLSDLARRIALDKRPNSVERQRALAAAALEPPIFRELWEAYGPLLPDRTVLESWLTIERGFNQQGAEAAVTNFISTVECAGLDKPADEPDKADSQRAAGMVQREPARIGDLVDWESDGVLLNGEPLRVRAVTEDGEWVFVHGSETGIPMEQVLIRERAPDRQEQRLPPTLPESPAEVIVEPGSKRIPPDKIMGPLDIAFDRKTVVVQGRSGSAEELAEFIDALEELKAILERSATKKNRFLSAIQEDPEEGED